MKPIKFKNNGELTVRLTSKAGHICTLQPGEEKAVPAILRGEALAANLSCLDKAALEAAGSVEKTEKKSNRGVSKKAAAEKADTPEVGETKLENVD